MEDEPPEVFLPSISNSFLDSHNRNMLSKSNYIELARGIVLWLTYSWTLNLGMVEVCARLLEEMLFIEINKSILVLGSEIYSTLPSLDSHYKKTESVKKGNTLQFSLPHIDAGYENIEVLLMYHDNAK